eukprot:31360-Pelagococcus_subviridis.AAC.5
MSTSDARESSGFRNCNTFAATSANDKSADSVASTSGFKILITTSLFDPRSVARCTCATDADASGVGSTNEKTSSTLPAPFSRSSSSTIALISANGVAGVSSRHF